MKIVVAEDHPESRYLLQQLFTGLGHEVSAVADGLEVLELLGHAKSGPPDAIVSDALMPRMDGFQLCRALRQHPRWCRLPFIFYTATYTDRADEQFALKLGADRFVVKPEEPERLMAIVHETIAQVKARPPREPAPLDGDATVLEEYTRRLSVKLEIKVAELEGMNEDLRASERAVRELNEQLTATVGALEKEAAERKQAEAQRARLETQLRQAQKMEAIGNLAGGIAHDFNNILTAVMAHAELLDLELPRETTGSHLRESVQEILMASARARDMVRQILAFSRKQPVERKRVEIDAVVRDALKLVRAALPPAVELRAELASQRAVMANEAQIHQVMLNLCTNAAQAMAGRGGVITVTLTAVGGDAQAEKTADNGGKKTAVDAEIREPSSRVRPALGAGEHVLLEIGDTGCGMDAATAERIFEPFFTTKGVGQGTGLGLAVVHGVIQAHEGTIAVESAPGRGSTFSIYLPALSGVVAPAKTSASTGPGAGAGQKILFVDDEPSVAKIGARLLERLGYTAVALTDPVAARDRLVNNPGEFDLVITDYLMPRVTGLDLSRAAWGVRPDLPMILAVGFGGQLDAVKAKAHGFREFVAKPFAIQTLAEAIARALGMEARARKGTESSE